MGSEPIYHRIGCRSSGVTQPEYSQTLCRGVHDVGAVFMTTSIHAATGKAPFSNLRMGAGDKNGENGQETSRKT